MLNKISQEIKLMLNQFSSEDNIIFNNKIIKIDKENFEQIHKKEGPTVAFVDGGQAEIISTGNFCLSFVRVAAVTFKDNKKVAQKKQEFYLFTKAKYLNEDLYYESKIFGDKSIKEEDLLISSNDSSIKTGTERAPISKITNMARRFAELSLASSLDADFVILDGTLEKTFANEENYLNKLKDTVAALAKSSSLFTTSGNSPSILLNKIGPEGCWNYFVTDKTYFVKLNNHSRHIFRFEGKKAIIPHLISNSSDALFLGYPYGLIFVDQLARVSNTEKNALKMNFLLRKENKEIVEYLNTSNAHEILDSIG